MIPIGIIGYGNMGEAFALGLQNQGTWGRISVLEKFPASAQRAQAAGFQVVTDLQALVQACEVILIAIKPQDIPGFLTQLKPLLGGQLVITVAAGLKTGFFQKELNTPKVIRFMPNLAAKEGKALVAWCPGEGCPDEAQALGEMVAAAGGFAAMIPEKLMSAITGLSGSGIALVFHFIHALALGGVREGFPYQKALEYALATVEGAVALLKAEGDHPIAFESRVTSPGGTTIEGVRVLESQGFSGIVMDAVSAASRRATELE